MCLVTALVRTIDRISEQCDVFRPTGRISQPVPPRDHVTLAVMTIDIHTHVVPLGLPDMTGRQAADRFPVLGNRAGNRAEVLVDGVNIRPVTSVCWDVGDRLLAMTERGVTRQVISPMPALLTYWSDPA